VLTRVEQTTGDRESREAVASRLAALTPRERQVMDRMLAEQPTKSIAVELEISERREVAGATDTAGDAGHWRTLERDD